MKILRTDGGGESFTNERLAILKKMLYYHRIKSIYMLHDHEGLLTVIWEQIPSENEKQIIEKAWEFFNEYSIEHKLIFFTPI